MSYDIEKMVKSCDECQQNQRQQCKEPLIPSDIALYPFQMIGTDLFYWNNQDLLLVVDYYSHYWEIERLYNTISTTVIKKMKGIFSRLGIPEQVISDSGPQYSSKEFKKFAQDWVFFSSNK